MWLIWGNNLHIAGLDIFFGLGLREVKSREAVINCNVSEHFESTFQDCPFGDDDLDVVLMPHEYNETVQVNGTEIYLKNLVPNRR